MRKTARITISLQEDLLQDIERESRASGETRSEFLRRAVEALLRRERQREAIEQYIQGYSQHPETQEELGWVEASSQEVLAEYPWRNEARE